VSNIKKSILFILFFLFSLILQAQIEQDKKSLSEILSLIQERHQCQFTYADAVIKDVLVKDFPKNLSLKESVKFLAQQTDLVFQFLDNNYITIKAKDHSFFVCGYLIDRESGFPIEMATLNGKISFTTTDKKGYFTLKVANDNDTIHFRHVGYRNFTKLSGDFNKKKCEQFLVNPVIYNLSRIVLKSIIAKGVNKVDGGATKINLKKLGILPGLIEPDVLQTLQALPGIQSANETVSNINIRGGTNDQNLLLWDDIRMYQSGHFFGLISVFNPLMTTDVTVVKNGSNTDLNSGVSGTVAMNTSTKLNTDFNGSIGFNFINIDGFVDVPLGKKSSFQLGARKAISNLVETPTYTQYFDRILQNTEVGINTKDILYSDIRFDFYDTSMRWLYKASDKDLIRVNFINISNELVFNEIAVIDQNDESKESNLIQNSIAGGIFYKRDWNTKFTTTLQAYETDYKLKAINADLLQHQRLLQENKVSETSVKLKTIYRPNENYSFLNGYQFIENGTTNLTDVDNPLLLHLEREVIREHGLYSQVDYLSDSKKTNFKVGVRYNYIEKFNKHIIEPRLSLNYKFSNYFNIEVLGEYKHQNVSQIINFQNDFLGIEKRRWRLSNNLDIPIIQSKHASLGLNYSKKGWLMSINGFLKNITGITSQSQGFLNQYIYEKTIGSYSIKGVDFLINKRSDRFSTWLSYSYADNTYTFEDFQEVNFPNNFEIKHSLTIGSAYTNKHFKTSVGLNWHSGIPTTTLVLGNEVVDNSLNFNAANSSNLDNYLRLDLSTTYNFAFGKKIKGYIGVSIWNALNKENILNEYYRINAENLSVKSQQKSLGRTPNLTIRLSF